MYRSESTPLSQEVSSLHLHHRKKINSLKMPSAFLWPPIQERGDFIEDLVDSLKFPQNSMSMENVKKGNEEKRLPSSKPKSHLSRHPAMNSFDNLPARRGRKLVYYHSAPLQQQRPRSVNFVPPKNRIQLLRKCCIRFNGLVFKKKLTA